MKTPQRSEPNLEIQVLVVLRGRDGLAGAVASRTLLGVGVLQDLQQEHHDSQTVGMLGILLVGGVLAVLTRRFAAEASAVCVCLNYISYT